MSMETYLARSFNHGSALRLGRGRGGQPIPARRRGSEAVSAYRKFLCGEIFVEEREADAVHALVDGQ